MPAFEDLKFDGSFDLATGRHRKELSWKNREWTWSALLARLSQTHRTAETYAEYVVAKKPRQDELKDVGGFVGGYLAGGKRRNGHVVRRQLVTLDIDYAHAGSWSDYLLQYDNAAAVYSTHKHSPEAPRLRLIIPLDRPVAADEYVAIARRLAGNLNIETFDHTTFEPVRLMYWPSTSSDGVFLFDHQDGPWLSADEVLATYRDWRDASEWPASEREGEVVRRAIRKQGDPLEKTGLIGAFCRTYTIAEVIDAYLADAYEATDQDDRYTYREGSTAGGLVVYDDRYAYSHHGTDPASGKLCNAFDLVRLHHYGLKDEDARADTPPTRLPSYLAMVEAAAKDSRVRKQLGAERLSEAREEFDEPLPDAPAVEADDAWMGELRVDRQGNYVSTIDNIFLILKNDPKLKDRICLNEFDGRTYLRGDLPWRKLTDGGRDFTDDDADCLAHYLEGFDMPFTHISKALAKIRTDSRYHPVRDYLTGLAWDGRERLDGIFTEYLGAEDSEYTRAVARKTLVAAVARVFQPGVKFDTVLTLIGIEGVGKSTLIRRLAGAWFSDFLGDVHTKEAMENLRGVWIMEVAELDGFRKADQEAIKRFITSTEDVYRPAYGRQTVRYPRQTIFFATTNRFEFLDGAHANRRFWPVRVHVQEPVRSAYADLQDDEIDQIWAEAVARYHEGESLILPEHLRAVAKDVRETHTEADSRIGLIEHYLSASLPDNWDAMGVYERRAWLANDDGLAPVGSVERTAVCVAEIWCEALGGQQKEMTSQNTKFIHDALRRIGGWGPEQKMARTKPYGVQRCYLKSVTQAPEECNAMADATGVFVTL